MPNVTTDIDTIELTDLEDGSTLAAAVRACTELGNRGLPGLQVQYLGRFVNLEPVAVERWAYQARKAGKDELLLEDASWTVHADQFVRITLVVAPPLRARVEVKVRSRGKPVVREYALPFEVE